MPRAEFQTFFDSATGIVRAPSDPTRRWTHLVGQLRQRASKLRRGDAAAPSLQDVLVDDLIVTCTSLLQELGGFDLQVQSRRAEAQSERDRADYLFEHMPAACVSTDDAGRILAANQAAGRLVNVSARHLKDRLLIHFAQDRSAFSTLVRGLSGHVDGIEATLTMRPRERAAVQIRATVVPEHADSTSRWFWFLAPTDAPIGSSPRRLAADNSQQLETEANV
jgi:PAS domain-containing protein